MTGTDPDSSGSAQARSELSEEQRAAIFTAANTPSDRVAAFRAARVPIPPKALAWTVAAILFLGLGGILGQHYFPSFSNNAPSSSLIKTGRLVTPTTNLSSANTINSLQAFMGLKFIGNATATDFTLSNQTNQTWNLAAQRGKVIVLTFYNSNCRDICPVVGAEIKQATQFLGQYSSRVEFVVVNTDPQQTEVSSRSAALRVPGLAHLSSVTFLTGSVPELNAVWNAYGIEIKVGAKANEVSHNNALYFIAPNGHLAAQSVPFGVESSSGVFSLKASIVRRYAQGIAETADSLFQR